ncbi:hypothetical protein ACTXT7_007513 [Hymenolepis weldensis]
MVELTGPGQPVKKTINNAVFIVPAILFVLFAAFCVWKIYYILNEPRSSKMKKNKAAKKNFLIPSSSNLASLDSKKETGFTSTSSLQVTLCPIQ